MTPATMRRAALTLRRLAAAQAAREHDARRQHQAERYARHVRAASQPRDAQGRLGPVYFGYLLFLVAGNAYIAWHSLGYKRAIAVALSAGLTISLTLLWFSRKQKP